MYMLQLQQQSIVRLFISDNIFQLNFSSLHLLSCEYVEGTLWKKYSHLSPYCNLYAVRRMESLLFLFKKLLQICCKQSNNVKVYLLFIAVFPHTFLNMNCCVTIQKNFSNSLQYIFNLFLSSEH